MEAGRGALALGDDDAGPEGPARAARIYIEYIKFAISLHLFVQRHSSSTLLPQRNAQVSNTCTLQVHSIVVATTRISATH